MANPLRAQVDFEAAGKPRTLVLGTNELVEVQRAMGYSFEGSGTAEFFSRLAAGFKTLSFHDWRLLLFYGLKRHDKEGDVTLERAGDILDELGPERVAEIFGEALQWAFPNTEGKQEAPKAPTTESPGTGTASSSAPAEPA